MDSILCKLNRGAWCGCCRVGHFDGVDEVCVRGKARLLARWLLVEIEALDYWYRSFSDWRLFETKGRYSLSSVMFKRLLRVCEVV